MGVILWCILWKTSPWTSGGNKKKTHRGVCEVTHAGSEDPKVPVFPSPKSDRLRVSKTKPLTDEASWYHWPSPAPSPDVIRCPFFAVYTAPFVPSPRQQQAPCISYQMWTKHAKSILWFLKKVFDASVYQKIVTPKYTCRNTILVPWGPRSLPPIPNSSAEGLLSSPLCSEGKADVLIRNQTCVVESNVELKFTQGPKISGRSYLRFFQVQDRDKGCSILPHGKRKTHTLAVSHRINRNPRIHSDFGKVSKGMG